MTIFFRRKWLVVCLLALVTACKKHSASPTKANPEPETGSAPGASLDYSTSMAVNLNEQVDVTDANDLADTKTKWVRCFIEYLDVYTAGSLNSDAKVAAFTALKAKGYKTVLNIKFNFKTYSFPAAGSSTWNNYLNYLPVFLNKVMPYTDVLVVGNEPFIEANQSDWDEPLNSFYKAACAKVYQYFTANNIDKPIFLGSFDNMYLTARTGNAGVNNLLAFVKETPYLMGADVHIHHETMDDMTSSLNYVSSRIRDDQKMLVTEFSLMKYWRTHNTDNIDPAFIAAANASTTDRISPPPAGIVKNYQYIDYALKNPRPAVEWYAFWQYSAYLESKKNYLCDAWTQFKKYNKVFLACYALRQSYATNVDFTADTDPWVLNGLFQNRSVEQVNGRNQKSYSFLDQYVKLMQGQSPCQ